MKPYNIEQVLMSAQKRYHRFVDHRCQVWGLSEFETIFRYCYGWPSDFNFYLKNKAIEAENVSGFRVRFPLDFKKK